MLLRAEVRGSGFSLHGDGTTTSPIPESADFTLDFVEQESEHRVHGRIGIVPPPCGAQIDVGCRLVDRDEGDVRVVDVRGDGRQREVALQSQRDNRLRIQCAFRRFVAYEMHIGKLYGL